MSQALKIIDELEVALKTGSVDRHNTILKSVSSLFLSGREYISDEVTSVFDDIIVRLVDHVESRARVELSMDLAPIAKAPNHVIQRLAADDDITVAGPVLAQSPQLTDQNLVDIATSKGQSHLSKIAERRTISPTVTDVLVDRGNAEVVTKVAVNTGARLSKTGMSMMVMRASGDNALTQAMSRRADITPVLFKRLLNYATEEARARMLAAAGPADREPSTACSPNSPTKPAARLFQRKKLQLRSVWCTRSARTPNTPVPRSCSLPTAIALPNWWPRCRS